MAARKYNPWMGFAPYPDSETTKREMVFCGRAKESAHLSGLVRDNVFVTLYGRNGTGKTSLLNAGVFPILRKGRLQPVYIRLWTRARAMTLQGCIAECVSRALADRGYTERGVEVEPAEESEDYLWSHFTRTVYKDKDGLAACPVIVLDQFEEVFRNRSEEAGILVRQIAYLAARCSSGGASASDFNFRIVVAIREDDYFRLEDALDSPQASHCIYRLRNLGEEGAREAIEVPSGHLFKDFEREKIVDRIVDIARDNVGASIRPVALSVFCNRLYVEYVRSGAPEISLQMVEKLARKGDPVDQYYTDSIAGLRRREKNFIESRFVDKTGRRSLISESEFRHSVRKAGVLLGGEVRIINRVPAFSDGSTDCVELMHDSLCEAVQHSKLKREGRKVTRWVILAVVIAILGFLVGIYSSSRNFNLVEKTREAESRSQMLETINDSISRLSEDILRQYEAALQTTDDALRQKYLTDSLYRLLLNSPARGTRPAGLSGPAAAPASQQSADPAPESSVYQPSPQIFPAYEDHSYESRTATSAAAPAKKKKSVSDPVVARKMPINIPDLQPGRNQAANITYAPVEGNSGAGAAPKQSIEMSRPAPTDYVEDTGYSVEMALAKIQQTLEKMASQKTFVSPYEEVAVNAGVLTVGGIEYPWASPTNKQIDEWKRKNAAACAAKIKASGALEKFDIYEKTLRYDPCVVYLILYSKAISGFSEKQSWLDLCPLIDSELLYKLYNILYRENYMLARIEAKGSGN